MVLIILPYRPISNPPIKTLFSSAFEASRCGIDNTKFFILLIQTRGATGRYVRAGLPNSRGEKRGRKRKRADTGFG
jgi:hypothetical protein